jgi:hypothetical protein
MANPNPKPKPEPKPEPAPARRPYRTPRLVDYGPIARIAAGGSGPMLEMGMSRPPDERP